MLLYQAVSFFFDRKDDFVRPVGKRKSISAHPERVLIRMEFFLWPVALPIENISNLNSKQDDSTATSITAKGGLQRSS